MFIYFACILTEAIRLIRMPVETQPIKLIVHADEFVTKINKEFNNYEHDYTKVLEGINIHDIFQLRTRRELVSSLNIAHEVFSDEENRKRHVVVIYSVVTTKKFRGLGYAPKLINDAVRKYVADKRLKNPIVALHLNPNDAMMNVNYALYYKLGFDKGTLCRSGPTSFKTRLAEIKDMKDVRNAMQSVESSREPGHFFAMFVDYGNFMKVRNVDMKCLIDEGEVLRKKLLQRTK